MYTHHKYSYQPGLGTPQVLLGHTAAVSRLRCPRRTDLLISSSLDGTVRVWGSGGEGAGADGSENSLGGQTACLAVLDVADFNLPTTGGWSVLMRLFVYAVGFDETLSGHYKASPGLALI